MAKNSIRDYDATSGNNTDVQSVDISEGCAASGINNAIREVMADLKDVSTGTVNLETPAADRLDVDNIRIDGNTISSTDTNGDITLDPDGTGDTIVASGNVGINDTTPDRRLHVKDSSNRVLLVESTDPNAFTVYKGSGTTDDGKVRFGATGDDALIYGGGSERLRITSGGNVGISTTSPSYLLHVDGMIGGKAVEVGRTGGAGHQGGSHFYLGSDLEDPNGITFTNANYRFSSSRTGCVLAQNPSGSGYLYEGTNDDSSSASRKFGVETDGDVRNTNNSYGSLSDQSIKQDIADASSQWEDIKNLRVRKFRLIADVEADADAPYHLGLVAQEVETVSPGLVKVEVQHDALKDADGNPILDDDGELQMQETGELKAVKYSILYMKAVKALQEAITKIETLETEMTALKARVTALEA